LKYLEKGLYLVSIPLVFSYMGYRIYRERGKIDEIKNIATQKAESDYVLKNANVKLLESFNKKVFVVGVEGENAENVEIVRNLIKDLRPGSVVLELCQTRYKEVYEPILQHPGYEHTMKRVNQYIDDADIAGLTDYKSIALKDLEYLVAIDMCSFRIPYCKTVLGDRLQTITQKRLKSKILMRDVMHDQEIGTIVPSYIAKEESKEASDDEKKVESIGRNEVAEESMDKKEGNEIEDSETLRKIRELIRTKTKASSGGSFEEEYKKAQDEEFEKQFNEFKLSLQKNTKSVEEIYQQVVVDEINEVIYNNVENSKGDVCVLVLDNERLLTFSKLWRDMNPLFYEARKGELHAKRSEGLQNISNS